MFFLNGFKNLQTLTRTVPKSTHDLHTTLAVKEETLSLRVKSFHCGMYRPLSDDKHRKVRTAQRRELEIRENSVPDKMQSETKFNLRIFS